MKKTLYILILLLSGYSSIFAQNVRFTTDGVIEFEKSINMYATIKKQITDGNDTFLQQAFDIYKKNQPQFKILKSTLAFSKDRTLFSPIAETETSARNFFSDNPAATQPNTTFSNLSAATSVTQKKVYEETFLVKDSIRRINWKITSETREIAGYECRRANAIIQDSIYVVAFYTDKIPVSGGPESFTGLPGMILGVALPHENITWFAKSVKDRPVADAELKTPVKGKPMNNKSLITTINAALKDWGSYAQTALKALTL